MTSEPNNHTNSSHDPDDTFSAGQILADRYRIVERIAEGGFGEILAAHDQVQDRPVAIKVLRSDAGSRDPAAIARMRQEAEILHAIDHPNIVEMYDVGEADWGDYFVMEYLDGRSVDQLLEEDGPIAPERAELLVKQLLSALAAAHRTHVMHRDIKPENIIVLPPDEHLPNERAKLVDFGIAKAQEILNDDPDEGVTLVSTRAGGFVGTPRYCSPEMAVGDPVDPSSDLFSLGLVLCEWFTGERVIDARTQGRVIAELIKPEPFDMSPYPERWQPWLARMIAKDPSQRFESAEDALKAFIADISGGDYAEFEETISSASPIGDDDFPDGAETTLYQADHFETPGDDEPDTEVFHAPTREEQPRFTQEELGVDIDTSEPKTEVAEARDDPMPQTRTSPESSPEPPAEERSSWSNWAWFFVMALLSCAIILFSLWLWEYFGGGV
ncbi:MAG: serine/threonine-protein kinase [Myxococcota bacterium]